MSARDGDTGAEFPMIGMCKEVDLMARGEFDDVSLHRNMSASASS
jgi:hypothetical protein